MKIGIVGLGWLGEPLYKMLLADDHALVGSTTQADKVEMFRDRGWNVRRFFLSPKPEGEGYADLFNVDILYVNIPPFSRGMHESFHPEQIRQIKKMVVSNGVKKVIYVSATSVYPSQNQEAREQDVVTIENTERPGLFTAEHIWKEDAAYDLTIIRFGGLLGDDRVPGRSFSGKPGVAGHHPANYVYRHDAARAIKWVIDRGLWNETYNVVAPMHPKKSEIYENNAKRLGFLPPLSYEQPDESPWKLISVDEFLSTGFQFDYPDPLKFPYQVKKP